MSNEVTIEAMNEVIARFMGMELKQDIDDPGFEWEWINGPNGSFWPNKTPPPFNKCWDWLMPVVEKISKMPLLNHDNTPCTDPQDVCYPYTFGMPNEHCGGVMVRIKGFGLHISDTLIEATFQAVYEVAEYHNQQKQTNEVST